jgi:uncharacterized protein
MNLLLSAVEARVLGALVEKQITTPEYYPLTLNALVNACNQKSNRDPITALEERDVLRAMESLREKTLARMITGPEHRVPKYGHHMGEMLDLDEAEAALLCELLLRGPQTPGELRGRASRMHPFTTVEQVEAALQGLSSEEGVWRPLVTRLVRQPGRKEARWAHLLSGVPEAEEIQISTRPEPAAVALRAEDERIATIERDLADLGLQVKRLREDLDDLRKQLE